MDAVEQPYTTPRQDHGLPSDATVKDTQRLAFDEGRFDLGLGIVSRFSEDSTQSEGGWRDRIEAPTNTPESEREVETDAV